MTIAENAERIKAAVEAACLAAHRPADACQIIAVTKYSDAAATREFVEAGLTDLAENRVQLLLDKEKQLSDLPIRWHLIGSLQSRKVKDIINQVAYFHALDSLKLAREIDKRANKPVKCFLEVNISGEESKHGFFEDELESAVTEISQLEQVEVIGLMTMAPIDADDKQLYQIFGKAKELQVRLSALHLPHVPCTELSMGMTRDYKIAIACGATYVRIGREFLK